MSEKPEWWPDNPYPEKIFRMPKEKYAELVPDDELRTGLSGLLGREFWDIASGSIWDATKEQLTELQSRVEELEKEKKGALKYCLNCKTIYAKNPRGCLSCRVEELEKYEAMCTVPGFKTEGCLAVGQALIDKDKRIAELKEENQGLKTQVKYIQKENAKLEGAMEKVKAHAQVVLDSTKTCCEAKKLAELHNSDWNGVGFLMRVQTTFLEGRLLAKEVMKALASCTSCGGSGEVPCKKCRGEGWYLERFSDNHGTVCVKCHGSKKEPCPDCKKGVKT